MYFEIDCRISNKMSSHTSTIVKIEFSFNIIILWHNTVKENGVSQWKDRR